MTSVGEMQYEKTLVRAWKDYRYETYPRTRATPLLYASLRFLRRVLHFPSLCDSDTIEAMV